LVHGDDAGLCLECCRDLLSSDERERAARFKFATDRERYIIAHGALRSILGSYLKVAPADLRFAIGSNGKPQLAPGFAGDRLKFNLSHSRVVSLVAVIRGREIGVDVEHIREDFPFDEVAQRFFASEEVRALRALPRRFQREAFYRCWTGKEALLKAKGTGLSGKLDEVEIVFTSEESVRIIGTTPGWTLTELSPRDGYVGAVAVAKTPGEIQCHRWAGLNRGCSHLRP
jgi:4'-phosphopantetheinyl transferase